MKKFNIYFPEDNRTFTIIADDMRPTQHGVNFVLKDETIVGFAALNTIIYLSTSDSK